VTASLTAEQREGLVSIAGTNGTPKPRRPLRARTADLTRVRPIRWAWTGRLPLGYLSLLLGAEGVGKGALTAWVLARLTRGELPGDLIGTPARVLIVGDEDSFDSVVVPRLYAAGANLGMVDTLDDTDDGDVLELGGDASGLRTVIRDGGYRVVVLDQLLDNLGVGVDDWRSKAVRDALRPGRRVARDTETSLWGSLHPNKGSRSSFRDLLSGTHAFNASSRSSLLLAEHPDDPDRRVLVRGKGNLSAAPPSFEFAIHGRDLTINDNPFSLPVVADTTESDLQVNDLLKPDRAAPVRDSLAEAIDQIGTGEVQSRSDIARAVDKRPDDKSVGRALEQLELDGRWLKEDRPGKWRRLGIGTSKEAPKTKLDGGERA